MTERFKEILVYDRLGGPLTMAGRTLADLRYEGKDRPRWTDMVLYRVADPDTSYRYAVETIGRSRVYHGMGRGGKGSCRRARHRITTAGDVRKSNPRWQELSPCPQCRPQRLTDMADYVKIAEEGDDSRLSFCINAGDVIAKLYRRTGEISELGANLLRRAALNDPELAQALTGPRRAPAWSSGKPEDVDSWLRDALTGSQLTDFYRWVAESVTQKS